MGRQRYEPFLVMQGSVLMKATNRLLVRLVCEERGQDLIEYALLTSGIGIAGLALFPSIHARMGTLFDNWGTQVHSLWIPPDPSTP